MKGLAPRKAPGPVLRHARLRPKPAAVVAGLTLLTLGAIWAAPHFARPRGQEFSAQYEQCFISMAPDQRFREQKPGAPFAHEVITDADGFRTAGGPPRAARCRLLFVGDSFTEGLFVGPDDAFPAVTEALLVARGFDVRSCNAGVRGHTIVEERNQALGRYGGLRFDTVVIAQTANDLVDLARLEALGCPLDGEPPTSFVRGDSRIALVPSARRELRRLGFELTVGSAEMHARCRQAGLRYIGVLADTLRRLRARGSAVVFASIEPLSCAPEDAPWVDQTLMPSVALTVRTGGGTFVDATAFARAAGARLTPHDSHPSRSGHASIARTLAGALAGVPELGRCR
jgi:hypothetical protein